MDLQLEDKVAVITGGSVGIGLAVANALAAEGVRVAICARDGERARARAEEIARTHGGEALAVAADVTDPDALARFAAEVEARFGGADILVNNAGSGSEETIMEADDARWLHYWELHLMAAVRLSRLLVPGMRRRGGGVILNNASICATQPLHYEPIYNVTKAALVMFSKCLANELIGDRIRVNAVNPGLVLTPDWHRTATLLTRDTDTTPEAYLERIARDNAPIGRFATPEEIADFFVFLCSPRASYAVGSTYYVDGGWLRTTT